MQRYARGMHKRRLNIAGAAVLEMQIESHLYKRQGKATTNQMEFAGKMNFYLAAVDDTLRHENDAPSIGLLLCRQKQALTVEYALRNVATPLDTDAPLAET